MFIAHYLSFTSQRNAGPPRQGLGFPQWYVPGVWNSVWLKITDPWATLIWNRSNYDQLPELLWNPSVTHAKHRVPYTHLALWRWAKGHAAMIIHILSYDCFYPQKLKNTDLKLLWIWTVIERCVSIIWQKRLDKWDISSTLLGVMLTRPKSSKARQCIKQPPPLGNSLFVYSAVSALP